MILLQHSVATPGHLHRPPGPGNLAQTGHALANGQLTLTTVLVIVLLALGLVATIAAAWLDLRADRTS